MAKDNTVQYYGRTLQLFPDHDRRSYARARVEVQERLDGQLLVQYPCKVLTPGDASPLADILRALAAAHPVDGSLAMQGETLVSEEHGEASKRCVGLGWQGDWYRDESRKCMHRDLVRAGMERARQQGKRIGRPKVNERPEFAQRFAAVVERIRPGGLSRRQAAKELAIGYATLKRLLEAQPPPSGQGACAFTAPVAVYCGSGSGY